MTYLRFRRLVQVIGVIILVLMVVLLIVLQIKVNNLTAQKQFLENSINEYNEYLSELNYKNGLTEEEYIKRYSREVLGYHSKNELIFKFDAEE